MMEGPRKPRPAAWRLAFGGDCWLTRERAGRKNNRDALGTNLCSSLRGPRRQPGKEELAVGLQHRRRGVVTGNDGQVEYSHRAWGIDLQRPVY